MARRVGKPVKTHAANSHAAVFHGKGHARGAHLPHKGRVGSQNFFHNRAKGLNGCVHVVFTHGGCVHKAVQQAQLRQGEAVGFKARHAHALVSIEAALHVFNAHMLNGSAVPSLDQRFLNGQLGQTFLAGNADAQKKAVRLVCAHEIRGGQRVDGGTVKKTGHQLALTAQFVNFFALHRAAGLGRTQGQVAHHDVFGHGHHAHILQHHGPQGSVGQQHAQGNAEGNLRYFIRKGPLRRFTAQAQAVQGQGARQGRKFHPVHRGLRGYAVAGDADVLDAPLYLSLHQRAQAEKQTQKTRRDQNHHGGRQICFFHSGFSSFKTSVAKSQLRACAAQRRHSADFAKMCSGKGRGRHAL